MSTKHTTTTQQNQSQQNVYDPQSMAAYHLNSGMMNQTMRGIMQNPFGNPFYSQTLRQGMGQANREGAMQMQNMVQGMQQRGIANGSPAAAYLTTLQGRMNSGLAANAFNNAQNQAYSMWGNAANYLGNFRPLQTGAKGQMSGTTTEKTSGLGTWLPQVAGVALGAATGGLAGGFKGALGGASAAMGGSNPFAGGGSSSPQMGMVNLMPSTGDYNGQSYNPVYSNPFGGPGVGYNTSPYLGVPGY